MIDMFAPNQAPAAMPFVPPELTNGDGVSAAQSGSREGGMVGYWKKPNGEIIVSQTGANGMRTNATKGLLFLARYRQMKLNGGAGSHNMLTDPYGPMLAQGGIVEFGAAQIIELGWHRKPHPILERQVAAMQAAGVAREDAIRRAMPQLADVSWEDHPCPHCRGRVFNSEGELASHEIMHSDEKRDRRLSDAMSRAMGAASEQGAAMVGPLMDVIRELAEVQRGQAAALTTLQESVGEMARAIAGQASRKG